MRHILLVDDEEDVLNAVRRQLGASECCSVLEEPIELETSSSPEAALQLARQQKFDVVIADYRMPEMDGIAFLKAFRKIQQDAERILLSGQADVAMLIQAMNEAHIYRFIAKPWNIFQLVVAIRLALQHHDLILENRYLADQVLASQVSIPELDRSAYRVMLVDDEPEVLKALARQLTHRDTRQLYQVLRYRAGLEAGIVVEKFTSPRLALQRAAEAEFDVAITDYRMSEMDGVAFLQALKRVQPGTARMILSGQADMRVLVEAINKAEACCFIGKPWHDYELKTCIAQAIDFRDAYLENRLLSELVRCWRIGFEQA